MKYIILILTLVLIQSCSISKSIYLKKNNFDLTSNRFDFPQEKFKILGFGAYHGSAKTETTEFALLKSLTKKGIIKFYLPETDYSTAHYFNEYLKTGDTLILKDLVINYGAGVEQEKSIETYEKWKKIKMLNDKLPKNKKIKVVGINNISSLKYTLKHLLEIANKKHQEKSLLKIRNMIKIDTTNFVFGKYCVNVLKEFLSEYKKDSTSFKTGIVDEFSFNHIINNLKKVLDEKNFEREKVIFENYIQLSEQYDFKNNPQFLRFGFGHLEKTREHNYPSFLTRLIENNIYEFNEVISIIGYLTNSRVLWDINYDKNGNYTNYTTEGGFGIGDYEKEYFRGIDKLKKERVSDITMFRLNKQKSPYHKKVPDLIEVIMSDEKSNGEQVKGKATTEFIDYAILISNSKANTPIYELGKNKN